MEAKIKSWISNIENLNGLFFSLSKTLNFISINKEYILELLNVKLVSKGTVSAHRISNYIWTDRIIYRGSFSSEEKGS